MAAFRKLALVLTTALVPLLAGRADGQTIRLAPRGGRIVWPHRPVITVQPHSDAFVEGETLQLCATVYGTLPLFYQWSFDGMAIPGATSACLTIPGVQQGNQGQYQLLIANAGGAALSRTVGVRVFPADIMPQLFDNDVAPAESLASECLTPYLPDANTPIRTLEINFNVFQKSDGTNNWPDTPQTASELATLVGWVNGYYAMYLCDEPSDPCPNTAYTLSDTKIRFRIAHIYFYQDDALWSSIDETALMNRVLTAHPTAKCQLNVLLTQATNTPFSGRASQPSASLSANQWVLMVGQYNPNNTPNYGSSITLAHEAGHSLDLLHMYLDCCPETCDTLSCIYLSDAFCPPTNPCLQEGDWNCDPYATGNTCTNNIMGATMKACHFTDLQIAKMHRALATKSVGKYLAPLVHYGFEDPMAIGDDSSGNGHDGVLGAAGIVTNNACHALNFLPTNGVHEFTIPDFPELDIVKGMTGMAWIRVHGTQSDGNPSCREGTIFAKEGSNWFQVSESNDALVFQNEGSGAPAGLAVQPLAAPLQAMEWAHVAFVREVDGRTVRFYLNGQPVGGAHVLDNPAFTNPFDMMVGNYGFHNDPGGCEFNGDIDEFQIFDFPLSAAAILNEFDSCELPCIP